MFGVLGGRWWDDAVGSGMMSVTGTVLSTAAAESCVRSLRTLQSKLLVPSESATLRRALIARALVARA